MFKFTSLCIFLCYVFVMVFSSGDIGPGRWQVLNIKKREQDDHKFKFDVHQRKLNRSHDGFNAKFNFYEDFTDTYSIRVDICKYVDGGCKPYQVLTDDSMVNFINKYAKKNREACLRVAGLDPPDFPIPKGEYEINNYVFNYDELPEDGIYGEYGAIAVVLDGIKEVSSLELQVQFVKVDDCEDHDEEDYED